MSEPLKVLDLFSGIGGFSLGLERTGGFRTIAFCEIDNYCQRVLRKHWPDVFIHSDIRKLGRQHFEGWQWPDVICGGFPCQDISQAGRGAGLAGERSGLWFEMLRVIRELRPKYIIVENVAALLGRGLGRVLGDLAESGYCAEWDCLPAIAFGAPHRRDRVFIVAYTHDSGCVHGQARIFTADPRLETFGEPFAGGEVPGVADATSVRCGARAGLHGAPSSTHGRNDASNGGQELAYADSERLERLWPNSDSQGWEESKLGQVGLCDRTSNRQGWWAVEPSVGRVAHGIPSRVDRIRGLGNAIVPQITEWLGRRVIEDIRRSGENTL